MPSGSGHGGEALLRKREMTTPPGSHPHEPATALLHKRKMTTMPPSPTAESHPREQQPPLFSKKGHAHNHQHHVCPPSKKTKNSTTTITLFERTLYGLDIGHLEDGLLLAQEKAEPLVRKLTQEERVQADGACAVVMAVQDEEGRRYRVLWRRRARGSGTYIFCGRGWSELVVDHQLQRGDVLQFLCCRGMPREGSGKLYLGVRVIKRETCSKVANTGTAVAVRASVVPVDEKKKVEDGEQEQKLVNGIPASWFRQ